MIVYFADRQLNILGQASTELPEGLTVTEDLKTEDVETGVATFECKIPFDKKTRAFVEECTEVGNYILRSHDSENELYTIIDAEIDTKKQEVYIYAEDDGMDLLNEVVGVYEADKAYAIDHYINKYASGAGFEIGINEAKSLTRKLSWDGESTAAERIASIATQFDGCEVSYSFEVDGLNVRKKFINIYKERGKDVGITLRLNQDVDRIVTAKSIANLATALQATGGTPEDENYEDDIEPTAVTLEGYSYDDGDFYVDGAILKSRKALQKWSRFLWKTDEAHKAGGHIVKQYSYDTTDQAELCTRTITELKKLCDMEVNYEIDITKFPDNVRIGDRINIVDDAGELYVSSRILLLKSSVADDEYTATLGEHLIKSSGISEKVAELAGQFAKNSASAARALEIAKKARDSADDAKSQVDAAMESVQEAQRVVDEVVDVVDEAKQSAANAQEAANNAQAVVDNVEDKIESLEETVNNAKTAADNAYIAANTAQTKSDEAKQAAENAAANAQTAITNASTAIKTANSATEKANVAKNTADIAKAESKSAYDTANAAKADAAQAEKDVAALGESLDTLSQTMEADYARKTALTETEASLRTSIEQNAAQISSTASKVMEVDETANNAVEQAAQAQSTADAAQSQADQATADAAAAQSAADAAAANANAAQNEADKAKAAAATAQGVADKANADLQAAKDDLATVTSRVGATEEEIAAAQEAVETAQAAADKAQGDADAAAKKAVDAQSTADTAVTNAANAQTAADNAADAANLAQLTADAAKGDAAKAQKAADDAASTAAEAQRTANTAVADAATAQAKANQAATEAAAAQKAADDADAKAAQAATDLATAKQNLANVTSRVDATEEEVEAAQAAVVTAQAAADKAKQDAAAAQSTADTAKANAATAQTAANNAKKAADDAQAAADDAQAAADQAQAAVDALAVRVTTAETKITQNSEQIALRATKTEVAQTLGGYYTKEQTNAAIEETAEEINLSVSAVRTEVENVNVGARNLIANTSLNTVYSGSKGSSTYKDVWTAKTINIPTATEYVVSFDAKADAEQSIQCFFYSPNTTLTSESSTGGNWNGADGVSYVNITTEWKRYWVRWTQTAADALKSVIVGRTFTANTVYIRAVKLEEGNRATSWSPAPEDQDAATQQVANNLADNYYTKTETNAQIKATSDSITSSVSATYATKQAVADIEVGGRNYFKNSDFSKIYLGTATTSKHENLLAENWGGYNGGISNPESSYHAHINQDTFGFNVCEFNESDGSRNWKGFTQDITNIENYKDNFRISVDLYATGTGTKLYGGFFCFLNGGTTQNFHAGQFTITPTTANKWERHSAEVKMPENIDISKGLRFYIYGYNFSTNSILYMAKPSLNISTQTTDWTPAPEDVNSDIDSAQTAASDAHTAANNAHTAADNAQDTADKNDGRLTSAESTIKQLADSIASLVRVGNSGTLVKQEEDGLWYLNLSGIEADVDVLKETAAALQGRTEYIRSYTDENGKPCIELGEGDTIFKVKITNEEVQFIEGSNIPTSINRKGLKTQDIEVNGEIIQGGYVQMNTSDGGWGLLWKGVNS